MRLQPSAVEDILAAAMPVQTPVQATPVQAMPVEAMPRRVPRFELSPGNILFGVFLTLTTVYAVFVFLPAAPRAHAEGGTSSFQETVTTIDQGLSTATTFVRQLVASLRIRSLEAATSTLLLVLPVLILLVLLDWYISRFLGNRNRVE